MNGTAELRNKVATGSRILAKLGLTDYLGHVSARVPGTDTVLIKGRGAEVGNMLYTDAEHVVLVDLDAMPVEEGGIRPPDETVLHTEIYRARPDVMSVVHTHQALATVFGIAGKPILPMQGVTATVLARPLAVYESSRKIVTGEQGRQVAMALGDSLGIHLRHHGIVMTGSGVEEAVVNAIWLEDQAKMTLLTTVLGNPEPMRQEEVEIQAKEMFGVAGRWNYYASLLG